MERDDEHSTEGERERGRTSEMRTAIPAGKRRKGSTRKQRGKAGKRPTVDLSDDEALGGIAVVVRLSRGGE
jgi:hypothetical protein